LQLYEIYIKNTIELFNNAAQNALYKRAKLNGAARYGNYSAEMEKE
jgi:hypothetical protein